MSARLVTDRSGSTAIETGLIALVVAVAVFSGLPIATAEVARISATLTAPLAPPAEGDAVAVRVDPAVDRVAADRLRSGPRRVDHVPAR